MMSWRPPVTRASAALAITLAALLSVVGWAAPASADPAGPTDYRSEVTGVEPPTPEVGVTIVGGDSFVVLDVAPGTEVTVIGYRGEPYLWFGPDGTVRQNERSPSRWQNDDRYGRGEVPPEATPDAVPDWLVVATDGRYVWHDHRTHWMNPDRPIGAEPGDTILEAVIPLVVDGDEVAVEVRSTLLAAPSPAPLMIGLLAGVAAGGAALLNGRRRGGAGGAGGPTARSEPLDLAPLAVATGTVAAAAAVLGWWAVRSVPAETGPSALLWVLPTVAVVVLAGAVTAGRRALLAPPLATLVPAAAVAVAGVELGLWSWIRRHGLVRALIPSDAPATIDRTVIAAAAVLGVISVVAAGTVLVRSTIRAPRPAPRR